MKTDHANQADRARSGHEAIAMPIKITTAPINVNGGGNSLSKKNARIDVPTGSANATTATYVVGKKRSA